MPKERKPLGRGKTLDEALKKIAKDRDLRIASLSEYEEVGSYSTGNLAIDAITTVGGLPFGRIIELYGPPSSGKTTTALQCAAEVQQTGGTVLYLDYEHALDPIYAKALGLDLDGPTFLFAQPETMEQGMNAARELIETGSIAMVIVDSVASMVIEKELSIETGGSTFADKAKIMAQTMRQLTPIAKRTNTTVIFLNHIQQVIDASPMGQKLSAQGVQRKTTPGGSALKFHSSMRVEFKPVGNVRTKVRNPATNEQEDMVTQTKVQVTCVKNKVGPPFRQCEVRVRFGRGFSQAYTVFDLLVAYAAIKKETGGVYRLTEATAPKDWDLKVQNFIKGEENFVAMLEEDQEWLDRLTTTARAILEEKPELADPKDHDAEDDTDVDALLNA